MDIAAASEEISPYDRLYWPDEQLRHCLASGEQRRELSVYLGADAYLELSALARTAAVAVRAGDAPRVWLVPGIMGSQLGIPRAGGAPPDLIWLDPIDMIRGDLYKLALTTDSPVRALGLVHHSYLRLWLRLLAAGFDVRPFAYDWRRDILELGAALAQAIIAGQQPVMLVAHSLGGANRLEFVNGYATGRVLPPVMASATKAQWIREYAERENINLSDSYAYSDSISDLPMLSIVGHPVAVCPDFRLKQTALQHDWAVLDLR